MSTLRHAFNAKSFNALSYKILSGKVPDMPTQYSPELLELMRAMLHLKPEKRPSARRVLSNSFIRKHIVLFLEATKDRVTNSRNHSTTIEDDVQITSQHTECQTNVHLLVNQSVNEIKMVNEKRTNQMEQQPIIDRSKEQNGVNNAQSILKQTLSIDQNDKLIKNLPTDVSKIDFPINNISKPCNQLNEAALNLCGQHEKQPHPNIVHYDNAIEDHSLSLTRHLSVARLRRRQRRRMSETEGGEPNPHHQIVKSITSNDNNSNTNVKSRNKISKYRSHSFSILPVSMLPKLHKQIQRVEDTNADSNNNNNSNHNIEQSYPHQINCMLNSKPITLICPSFDVNQAKKNRLEFKSNSIPQTNPINSDEIQNSNLMHNITSIDQSNDIFKTKNLYNNAQMNSVEQENIENDVNNGLVHQNEDKEIDAVVNCLTDTLKDGFHPGAPVIIPRCKNVNKAPMEFSQSTNYYMSKDRKFPFKSNFEDNGPIEPKEETINRSVHLKQRFIELQRECIENVGLKKLHEAYEILDQDLSSESQEILLKQILGVDIYSKYMSKIWQLKLLEQNTFEKE
ncbi:unnamed protein product [Schistosoma turkestanicum]|nr:unnamed protein product [Schistosoma turkestanicum]